MIGTLAIEGYRSLRQLVLPLGRLNLVTGANGSGKSSLYRALRLLAEVSGNAAVGSLAREGGLASAFWAGPETIARSVRLSEHAVEPLAAGRPAALKLGYSGHPYSYSIELGYPPPLKPPLASMFALDPHIKREALWHGPVYRKASALVERRNNYVWLATVADVEPEFLTQQLGDTDSMLAAIADPGRAPEMVSMRERLRGWRFYDSFRTDRDAPARGAQVGTWTPVLAADGADLAAALQTITEVRSDELLAATVEDAFPGSRLFVENYGGRFEVRLHQHGLLRPLSAAELSDGTLRFLLCLAALLTTNPPELMVLNEPETSLHPDLLPALARLIAAASASMQMVVVSHAPRLIEALAPKATRLHLRKDTGETVLDQQTVMTRPKWVWPSR